jgi:hypothetical protein
MGSSGAFFFLCSRRAATVYSVRHCFLHQALADCPAPDCVNSRTTHPVSFLSAVLFVSDCLLIHITLNPIPHTRHGIQYLIHASLNPIPPTRARNQNRIPSLGGPASIASRTDGTGFKWLTDFSSGGPPLGWHDTIAYLILPVLLVVSQRYGLGAFPNPASLFYRSW